MSEHLWTEENVTAHVMGGLEGLERERIEAHFAECAECAREFDAARDADRKLQELFMSTRPNAALEDRVIQTLREEPIRMGWFRMPRSFKVAIAAAAAILLAVCGAGVTSWMEKGGLNFPWEDSSRAQAANNLRQTGVAAHGFVSGLAPAGTFTTDLSIPVQGSSFEAFKTREGMDLQDADALAKELRADAVKSLEAAEDVAEKKLLAGRDGEGRTHRVPVAKNDPPGVVLSDGLDTKTRFSRGGDVAGVPASPSAPGESKAGSGEWGRMPSINGAAVDKPVHEEQTKAGGKKPEGGSFQFGGVSAKPEGESKFGFRMVDKRAYYFKPADAFTKGGSKPSEPAKPDDSSERVKEEQGAQAKEKSELKAERPNEAPPKPAAQADPQIKKPPQSETKTGGRKIIRSGDIEFEIESFDSAVATIIRLVNATKGGFVATINSDKLPNGKVRGSVVVRVPPEELDKLVLDFRKELGKTGELKSQRIGSQDITKQYTDLESRLRAARTMEDRLLKIIADGKGAIKDLLQAEKELGVWRTKIEEYEGELRYYSNLVALSTLNVILTEKEIRTAASVKESERVNAGIEVEDVEKAMREALQAITENKGRVTRSELKQHGAGQFNALLHFETPPENAGPMRDRLKQLGNMVRLEIDRVQQTEGGATAPKDGKIKKGDSQFFISIYNLAKVAPRETVVLRIAATSVTESYQKLRETVGKAKGRVVNAQFSEQDPQNLHALVEFDIRRLDEAAVQLAIKDAGETITRQVSRVPEGENVTDSKIHFRIELVNAANIPPREAVTLKLVASDVPSAYQAFRAILLKISGKVTNAQLNEQDRQNISANLDFSINRTDETALQDTMAKSTEVLSRHVARQPESAQVSDTRVHYRIEIAPAARIPPREVVSLAIEVGDVQKRLEDLKKKVNDVQGRVGPGQLTLERSGRMTARAHVDVPLAQSESVAADFKRLGIVRVHQTATDQQAPEGKLAIARFDVMLSNEVLVPQDEGLWAQIQKGLSVSLRGLLLSVSFLVVGLLFVGPWVLVVYVVILLVRRMWRTSPATQTR